MARTIKKIGLGMAALAAIGSLASVASATVDSAGNVKVVRSPDGTVTT